MRSNTAHDLGAAGGASRARSLAELLSAAGGAKLPLSAGLYAVGCVARLVADEHEAGRVVGALDLSRVLCEHGRVSLAGNGGTPVAPELRRGEPADRLSDVYAVGHLAYQVLTGLSPKQASAVDEVHRLHEPPAPSRFNPAVDGELDALILAALAVDPSSRPYEARAFVSTIAQLFRELDLEPSSQDLESALTALAPPAPAPPPAEPRLRPATRWQQAEEEDDAEDDEQDLAPARTNRREWTRNLDWLPRFEGTNRIVYGVVGGVVAFLLLIAAWPTPKRPSRGSEPVAVASTLPTPAPAATSTVSRQWVAVPATDASSTPARVSKLKPAAKPTKLKHLARR